MEVGNFEARFGPVTGMAHCGPSGPYQSLSVLARLWGVRHVYNVQNVYVLQICTFAGRIRLGKLWPIWGSLVVTAGF